MPKPWNNADKEESSIHESSIHIHPFIVFYTFTIGQWSHTRGALYPQMSNPGKGMQFICNWLHHNITLQFCLSPIVSPPLSCVCCMVCGVCLRPIIDTMRKPFNGIAINEHKINWWPRHYYNLFVFRLRLHLPFDSVVIVCGVMACRLSTMTSNHDVVFIIVFGQLLNSYFSEPSIQLLLLLPLLLFLFDDIDESDHTHRPTTALSQALQSKVRALKKALNHSRDFFQPTLSLLYSTSPSPSLSFSPFRFTYFFRFCSFHVVSICTYACDRHEVWRAKGTRERKKLN